MKCHFHTLKVCLGQIDLCSHTWKDLTIPPSLDHLWHCEFLGFLWDGVGEGENLNEDFPWITTILRFGGSTIFYRSFSIFATRISANIACIHCLAMTHEINIKWPGTLDGETTLWSCSPLVSEQFIFLQNWRIYLVQDKKDKVHKEKMPTLSFRCCSFLFSNRMRNPLRERLFI